ncbi:MAG: PTS IIA-like nitrogen regulatory protein PtsN [Pseudomonadota bacterium]
MNINQLIDQDHVLCCPEVASKKRLLEVVSELLAVDLPQISAHEIFDSLINREKLGSTGLGKGVAIPHGRMASLENPVCAFIRLDEAVEFDATDGKPVDLAFALLVPEDSTEEHLQVLSTIAELFSDEEFCTGVRNCKDKDCLMQLLINRRDVQQIPA